MVCFFFGLVGINSVQTTFTPISSVVAEGYGTSQLIVNTCAISYFVCFILFNFPIILVLEADKPGQRSGIAMMISVSQSPFNAQLAISC